MKLKLYLFLDSTRKEAKKRIHEEVIAEDYDSTKDEINPIDISQKFMASTMLEMTMKRLYHTWVNLYTTTSSKIYAVLLHLVIFISGLQWLSQ